MKRMRLLPLLTLVTGLAACSSGPSKEESARVYGSANTAMSSARTQAVSQAQTVNAPADLVLDYSGPCTLGGTVSLSGAHSSDAMTAQATFDLTATFDSCHEAQGTVDGSLAWSSSSSATGTTMSTVGDLDWDDGSNSASCDIDIQLSVGLAGFSYMGTLCGYDVGTELDLGR